ncbi:CLUMA_CG000658, isoform A [Clunio marinus]|uniref:CLUMA_CG000658, isoform A n=1 Tax=Clunio marinus TaxID=568069 RepID=A0A1J1HFN3_9DIPT|nr:CLUMA_CG000658, isoform A [Clunio marinus]
MMMNIEATKNFDSTLPLRGKTKQWHLNNQPRSAKLGYILHSKSILKLCSTPEMKKWKLSFGWENKANVKVWWWVFKEQTKQRDKDERYFQDFSYDFDRLVLEQRQQKLTPIV